MTIRMDTQRNEVHALAGVADWRGRRVLEIGCGDGRLTLRLASLGAVIEAIDPDAASIRAARRALPARLAGRVRYRVGVAERLKYPAESFDRVVFAWSLC
jgi:ubiquinone/menaquinone biosynthesis C-methylase UbiE